MFNQVLLKKINILYVEDEKVIQKSVLDVCENIFNNIFVASSGQEGLNLYKKLINNNIVIDIIISDINMPDMNGIDMLLEIRKFDPYLPFIITSAHTQSEHFLQAIKLNVAYYALKPLKIDDLVLHIQDICHKKYQEMIIENKYKESERYLDIINKVAIVTKTDIHGDIIYVNDMFCEISGYSRDELIGTNQRIVRHPEMGTPVFDDLWNTLRAKNIWRGKMKNKAKDGSTYVVNAHIFPVFNESGESVIEYMAVRFLITEEENKKRKFHQKVISNIQGQRKKEQELNDTIKKLEEQLEVANYSSILLLRETLSLEKQKTLKAKSQILHYENKLKYENTRNHKAFEETQKRLINMANDNKKYKTLFSKSKKTLSSLELEMISKHQEIKRINEMLTEQAKVIADLKDVIAHREEQLETKK